MAALQAQLDERQTGRSARLDSASTLVTSYPESPAGERFAATASRVSIMPSRAEEPFSPSTGGPLEDLRETARRSLDVKSSWLDDALAALKQLVTRDDVTEGEWMHAARLLKNAAVERRHSAPRIASVALMLGDALTFTEVGTVALADREPLRLALRTLMQTFVSTDDERSVFRALVEHRWYVTSAFDAAPLGALAE